jgi:hypothetical protein
MLKDSIAILAATTPPAPVPRVSSIADGNALVVSLENRLGVKHGLPIFNNQRLARRIEHLESLIAANPPLAAAAAIAAPVAAATLPANLKPLADYLRFSNADRLQFAQDGGALAQADFETLKPKAKMGFVLAGGKIWAGVETPRRIAPGNVNPGAPFPKGQFAGNGATKTEAEFESLSSSAKMEFMRTGGNVV